jgi:type IV secretory pathway component VirB8
MTFNASMLQEKNRYTEALDWETSRIYMIEKSERRAWKITISAVLLVLLSWLAIVCMLPIKETIPYVIRVNNVTGVPDIVTALQDKKITYEDVMDKYWVASYVRARETYDWYSLQKDYDTVGVLSSPQVGAEYAKLFQGENALDKKFANTTRAVTEIVSVVPNGKGIATVRFVKHIKRVGQEGEGEKHDWVATVTYAYLNPSLMKESLRLVNPFGFQVRSYRVDPELVGDNK